MAVEVKISGTTYKAADDFTIRQQAGAVSLSTISVLRGANPAPQPLQAAQILIDSVPVFYGIIATVQDPVTSTGHEPRRYTLDVQSMEVIFNFRLINRNWYNQRIDQIIADIFTDYLAEEGLTLGGISEITEEISAYRKTYQKISEILDELADKVGRASYYISPDKKFYFLVRDDFTTVAAPDHVSNVTRTRSYGDLRTVQITKGASAGITGTYTNAATKAAIAALSGTSGKIESLKSDSTIRNPTAAALDALATAEQHAEEEVTISCLCHDMVKSALYNEWEIPAAATPPAVDIWPQGFTGFYVVTERTITRRGPDDFNIHVTLKNRNYFARYGYSLKSLATSAGTSQSRLDDENSPDRLTPAKKILARLDFTLAANTVSTLGAQAAARGITSQKTAMDNAFQAMADYLNAGSTWSTGTPAMLAGDRASATEDIDGATYEGHWSTFYAAKDTLAAAVEAIPGQKNLATLSDPCDYTGQFGIYQGLTYLGTAPSTWTRITAKRYDDVTDATALAALAGMIAGDRVYMTSTKQWYKYTTAWVTDGPAMIDAQELAGLVPKNLGLYNEAHPTSRNPRDWWTVYGGEAPAVARGIYYDNEGTPTRISAVSGDTGYTTNPELLAKLSSCVADVAWAEKNGYGTSADYGISVFFESMAAVTAFIQNLYVDYARVTGKPTLGSLAALDSLDWSALTGKPEFGDLAAQDSISWDSSFITGKPTLGSLALKSSIVNGDITDATIDIAKLGTSVIQGGHIAASLLTADIIKGLTGIFDNITITNGNARFSNGKFELMATGTSFDSPSLYDRKLSFEVPSAGSPAITFYQCMSAGQWTRLAAFYYWATVNGGNVGIRVYDLNGSSAGSFEVSPTGVSTNMPIYTGTEIILGGVSSSASSGHNKIVQKSPGTGWGSFRFWDNYKGAWIAPTGVGFSTGW